MTFRRKSNKQARKIMRASSVVAETRGAKVVSNQMLVTKVPKMPTKGHICIIRSVGGIGDVLMMTPGIRALKEQNPNLEITVAVDMHTTWDKSYREMLKNAPFIDHLIDARYVNRNKFTKVVDISSVCIAFEKKELRVNNRIDLFARALGVKSLKDTLPFYRVETDERSWASQVLKDRKCFGKTIVGFNPESNDSKRSWSRQEVFRFIDLLSKQKNQTKVILFDFANSYPEFSSLDFVINASKTTVRQMAALIERCNIFVTPDTGPMHIAGALGVPSVCLFGSIPPQARINHYPSHVAITSESLDCLGCWYSPCQINTQCMKDIKAEKVYKLVLERMRFDNEVIFKSTINPIDGYGSSAEEIVCELSDLTSVGWNGWVANDWEKHITEKSKKLITRNNVCKHEVLYYPPDAKKMFISRSLTKNIFTMWETSKIPVTWVPLINSYDKLIVPCSYNKEVFQNSGVTIPTYVCPLGVNEKFWKFKKRDNNGKVRFLMFANAGWENERKNYGLAVSSFIKAFGNSTNVELVLKVITGEVPREILERDNITVVEGRFSKEELRELIYSCDCLLSPTASEGYGLPQREAMATGIPVIAVNYSGLEPIMSLDFNYPVEYTEVSSDYWKVPHFVAFNLGSKDLGVWAKPRLESIVAQLRKAADNKKILLAKGEECSVWINENETSERAAKTLLDIIRSKNP